MATISRLTSLLCLCLLLLSLTPEIVISDACQPNPACSWCVANPSASEMDLQNNIEFACSKIDCALIQGGGSCYYPETAISHASAAMNSYYQSVGRNPWNCYFGGSGLIVTTDPSYGACKYECAGMS